MLLYSSLYSNLPISRSLLLPKSPSWSETVDAALDILLETLRQTSRTISLTTYAPQANHPSGDVLKRTDSVQDLFHNGGCFPAGIVKPQQQRHQHSQHQKWIRGWLSFRWSLGIVAMMHGGPCHFVPVCLKLYARDLHLQDENVGQVLVWTVDMVHSTR